MATGETIWETGGMMEGRAVEERMRLAERGALMRVRRNIVAIL